MRKGRIIAAACGALLLNGCFGASTNPREGGLFGYSPSTYEQRRQERESTLAAEERKQQEQRAASAQLEDQRRTKNETVAAQQKKVDALKRDITAAGNKLNSARAANTAQEQKLGELRQRQQSLQQAVRGLGPVDTAQKEVRLRELQEEARRLEQEAEALSQL